MIVGDVSKHVLFALQNHPKHKFYLTGSRYFDTYLPMSDWDFFAEETREVKLFLVTSLGFRPDPRAHHDISYTGGVQPRILLLKSGDIHVQLVPSESINEKLAAQQFLFDNGIIKDIASKNSEMSVRKILNHSAWDTAVLVVRKAITPASDPFFPGDGSKQFQNSVKPVDTIPKPNRKMEW